MLHACLKEVVSRVVSRVVCLFRAVCFASRCEAGFLGLFVFVRGVEYEVGLFLEIVTELNNTKGLFKEHMTSQYY